jgi:MFS family permease
MRQVYGFDTLQVTLIQLAVSVGAIIATLLNPFQDSLYFRSARDNPERPGHPIPEARIYTAVPGSLLFAAAMFWFGATANAHTSFWVPTVALAAFGIGVYSIYLGVTNYLADAYEKYAASALSAAGFGRNVFGAFLPLATPALYRRVGVANASYLLGAIALVLTALPCILLWRGAQIRARSPFMLEAVFDVEEGDERKKSLATAKGQSLEEFEEGRRASAVAQYAR